MVVHMEAGTEFEFLRRLSRLSTHSIPNSSVEEHEGRKGDDATSNRRIAVRYLGRVTRLYVNLYELNPRILELPPEVGEVLALPARTC